MNKILKIFAVLLGIAGILGLGGYVLLWISFSGGIDGVLRNLKPNVNPNNKQVSQKRNEVLGEINASFKGITAKTPFNEFATSIHDRCHRGESGWKRSDYYSNQCTYKVTKFYGFDGDFKQIMLSFEDELFDLGWKQPEYSSHDAMDYIMDMYDDLYGKPMRNGNGIYNISYLPSSVANYYKNDQVISMAFAERSTSDFSQIKYLQSETSGIAVADVSFEDPKFQDIPSTIDTITKKHRWVLIISIHKKYFEN